MVGLQSPVFCPLGPGSHKNPSCHRPLWTGFIQGTFPSVQLGVRGQAMTLGQLLVPSCEGAMELPGLCQGTRQQVCPRVVHPAQEEPEALPDGHAMLHPIHTMLIP